VFCWGWVVTSSYEIRAGMSYDTIRTEEAGAVLVATIDHPASDVNAIDGRLHHDLDRFFSDLRTNHDYRAVVLTGSKRAFSAGGDYGWFPELQDPVSREEVRAAGKRIVWNLLDIEVPIVAAVNGPAMGLGATIALLCDVVLMSDAAVIGDPHVRVGLVAGDGGTGIWPLLIGPMLAKRYLLTGDPISAAEAHRLGLTAEVHAPEELGAAALSFAGRLAAGAPLALRYTKLAVNSWVKQMFASSFDVALGYEVVTMGSEDHAEAINAIEQRRPPEFRGR